MRRKTREVLVRDEDQKRFKAGKPVEAALPIKLPEVRWVPDPVQCELVPKPVVPWPVIVGDVVKVAKSPGFKMTPDAVEIDTEYNIVGESARVLEILGVTNHPAVGSLFFFKVQKDGKA
jgi:hypothetical protein